MENEKINQADDLMIRYLTGMAEEGERETVLNWIRHDPEKKRYFDELKAVYEATTLADKTDGFDVEAALLRVKTRHYKNLAASLQKAENQNNRIFWLEVMKYAALILFLVTVGFIGYRYTRKQPDKSYSAVWNTIEAPFGSRARLTLTDGTKVWLNAGSQLRYSTDFNRNNRKVFLNGEAYFDVAKDETRQFIVSTPHLDVKVFGTRFNVKAYAEEKMIQTTLVEGSVEIEGKGQPGRRIKKVLLKPNESAMFYFDDSSNKKGPINRKTGPVLERKEQLHILKDINPVVFTSWKDKNWVIDGETLFSLAVKLERRYNVNIEFAAKELEDYKFRGIIKDETLEQVLNVIKLSAPIEYSIRDNSVRLLENKKFKNQYDEMLIKN